MAVDLQLQAAVEQILHQPSSQPHYDFAFTDFLKREYRFGLDPDRPPCKAFLQGHCPQGNSCPDKHHVSSSYNNLVCKHWLRGLCKKAQACEFLHEYNLRRMPECSYFARHQTCSNGEDCLYLHVDPASKRPACPHYERGFCPLGPRCANKHVRKAAICPLYLAGFCPDGRACARGAHPKYREDLKKPEVRGEEGEGMAEGDREQRESGADWDRGDDYEMDREQDRSRPRDRERDRERDRDGGGQGQNQGQGGGQRPRGGWQQRKRRSGGRHRR